MGPIAYLRANQIEVRVKQVPFSPNFIFAFTGTWVQPEVTTATVAVHAWCKQHQQVRDCQ